MYVPANYPFVLYLGTLYNCTAVLNAKSNHNYTFVVYVPWSKIDTIIWAARNINRKSMQVSY